MIDNGKSITYIVGGGLISNSKKIKEFSLIKVEGMIFVPSIILGLSYYFIGLAQPPIPSILLFFILAIPMFLYQISAILVESKKTNNSYSLKSAFCNYEKMSLRKIVIYSILLVALAGIISFIITPIESAIFEPVSGKFAQSVPEYFNWSNTEYIRRYPSNIITFTCIGYFIFNVFIGPITEELFFRGLLTSRLNRFGRWTPFIVTVLFSLYHFWLPFNNLFRIFAFFPAAFIAWKKKNIYIAITFHCLCNLASSISFLATIYP